MKRTFFDKVILAIIALVIIVFMVLASYMTYATQKTLVTEKQNGLINQARLVVGQIIVPYLDGATSLEYAQTRLDEVENTMLSHVWFFDEDGQFVMASNPYQYEHVPEELLDLDAALDVKEDFSQMGTFYGMFEDSMISVGLPVSVNNERKGYIILHTSVSEVDDVQENMLSIMYMPFMVMILVVGVVLAYLSGTVIRPLAKLNVTAREYAKGNFDAKTGVEREDEIGELAESLEYMASELGKLDEYRKEFIANISHDFRSPLTSIKGYLEAMIDGTIPVEKYDRYLNIVLNESKRLTKLTAGLLELNNFDTYGPILKKKLFDIMDVIRETRNTVEGRCEQKHVELRLDCSAKDSTVFADKMKVGQVINNLVDNAIKFSPEYSVITVSVYEKSDKLFISVRDEGPGIEKDKQKKVFDRFYKTDSSRGKDKQGTGLGLSIAKEIIKAHGENIELKSTEGLGSEFIFSLPRKEED